MGRLAAWEECDWEGRSRGPRDGVDRFGGRGVWGMGRACGAGHMYNAYVCVRARVCARGVDSGCVWAMCVCEKIPIARCTCIPEGRSVRLARLRRPVVARCRAVIVEVRQGGLDLERPEGGGVGRSSAKLLRQGDEDACACLSVCLAGPVSVYGQQ